MSSADMTLTIGFITAAAAGIGSVFLILRFTSKVFMALIPSVIGIINTALWIFYAQGTNTGIPYELVQFIVLCSIVLVLANIFTVFFYWFFTRSRSIRKKKK